MVNIPNFAKAIAQAAEEQDYNEAVANTGFTPLEEGPVRLRFVSYIELGKHEKKFKNDVKIKDLARFGFEVTGPKVAPREDGQPHVLEFTLTKSQNEKAPFYKLFRRMNADGSKKIYAELLGNAYRGTIHHNKVGEGAEARTYANLTDKDGGFTITDPWFDDPESGERKTLAVDEPQSPIRCFLWDYADQEQWDSIFIDGEWEAKAAEDGKPAREAKSKNVHQEFIRKASNWIGSPMSEILLANGLTFADGEKVERKEEAVEASKDQKAGASGDPLNEIG